MLLVVTALVWHEDLAIHRRKISKQSSRWEAFAGSLLPAGQERTSLALRDHASQILLAIVQDIESEQTDLEQTYKSKGLVQIA